MNPNDYKPQDTNNQNSTSVPYWFQDTDPAPVTKKPTNKKPMIALFVLLGVMAITAVAILFSLQNTQQQPVASATCLSEEDYSNFTTSLSIDDTASPYDDIKPKTIFNTLPIYFESESDSYSALEKNDTELFIENIGSQYSNEAYNKTLTITLSTVYLEGQSAEVATKRLEKIKNALISAGVPSASIKLTTPTAQAPVDEADSADVPVNLDVATTATC